MPSSSKRLTKEQLKRDEITASLFKLIGYSEKNYPKILAGLAAIVVLGMIGYFVQDSANRRTQAAYDAIGDVEVALMQGNTSSAITRSQAIVRDYSGEKIAGRALVTLANIYFDQGRYEESTGHYRQYLDALDNSADPQTYGAWAGIAAAMEAQNNLVGAAEQFVAYADKHAQTTFAPLALMEAGRCYQLADDLERAKQIYLQIWSGYRNAPVARAAETELAVLGHLLN